MAFLVHRWLGIGLALLMAVWAVSGIVMMYVSFPETTVEERLAGLEPLNLVGCCDSVVVPDDGEIDSATVEMVGGKPVLRRAGPAGSTLVGLSTASFPVIREREAGEIATAHMQRAFKSAPAVRVEPIGRDQWTVYGRFRDLAPLYKASFGDARGTVLYVSGKTGEIVQDTTAHERFWNWLGAVPHWLYFTALRENTPLWSNVVIYASLLGTFLTLTGIYVGLRMYRRGKHRSPFRGIALWHHWAGLIFGILTLTWVFSGLASMNPWGWLESDGPGDEIAALAGRPVERGDVEELYRALSVHPQTGVVSAQLSIQNGRPYAILVQSDGERRRAALPGLEAAPPGEVRLGELASAAKPGVPVKAQELISAPDAYYYAHHNDLVLPAWRVIYADEGRTRLYFDPRTGELVGYADPASRAFRWWHSALHRLDLSGLNDRPLWDAVMLPLLLGVSLLCLLGVWMGVRRLAWRSRWFLHKVRRRPAPADVPTEAERAVNFKETFE